LQRELPNARSYLEVGVQYGATFEGVRFAERVGVDPFPLFDLETLPRGASVIADASDNYFEALDQEKQFDVIFLDGLHEWFQTYKDVINSLNHLTTGGVVLVDDVIPCDEISAIPSLEESYRIRMEMGSPERRWHGDVFKVLFAIHENHSDVVQCRVIIDPEGNSQAVLWRCDPLPERSVTRLAASDSYEDLSFGAAFPEGRPPSFFAGGSEEEVLQDVVSKVIGRRQLIPNAHEWDTLN